jgi:septal ring factor EnvC (AmiA/AmiB activator)
LKQKLYNDINYKKQKMTEEEEERRQFQDRIAELENVLKIVKSDLLHINAVLSEEKRTLARILQYTKTIEEENARLRLRLERLINEAEQSDASTEPAHSRSPELHEYPRDDDAAPMSPVSVSVSPRESYRE